MRFQHAANTGFIERFHPKTKMIEISSFRARRSAAGTPQLAFDRHEVNQRSAGPQLHQTYRILSAFDRASQHPAVKMKHLLQINHAQDQVINFANANHGLILIQLVAARTDASTRTARGRSRDLADDVAACRLAGAVAAAFNPRLCPASELYV
jgi:hypothetical protein